MKRLYPNSDIPAPAAMWAGSVSKARHAGVDPLSPGQVSYHKAMLTPHYWSRALAGVPNLSCSSRANPEADAEVPGLSNTPSNPLIAAIGTLPSPRRCRNSNSLHIFQPIRPDAQQSNINCELSRHVVRRVIHPIPGAPIPLALHALVMQVWPSPRRRVAVQH